MTRPLVIRPGMWSFSCSLAVGHFLGGFIGIERRGAEVSLRAARLATGRETMVPLLPCGLAGAGILATPGRDGAKRPVVAPVSGDAPDFAASAPRPMATNRARAAASWRR